VRGQKIPFEISAQRALPGEPLELFTDTTWSEGEH
jgi:DNA damage-inducible protein